MENQLINQALDNYLSFKNESLVGRYITYDHIDPELEKLRKYFHIEEIGRSVLDTPVPIISIGTGETKVLAWSQMHGNESTTTKAIFDLLNLFKKKNECPELNGLLEAFTIKIIPMLNPDGAQRYTRENANSVDLNRDAHERKEIESKVLKQCFDDFMPDYCLNLHDQRTIFSAGDTNKPATLSFLAPSMDEERNINTSRKKSMQIIGAINQRLQKYLPERIGRYDDAFNINCTGDSFQVSGVPTILFEAGHCPNDYQREETRKYMMLAILSTLLSISSKDYTKISVETYLEIPENRKNFFDVILKNAEVKGEVVDVAIQFEEKISAGKIIFNPVIQIIDTSVSFYGHRVIDCATKKVTHSNGKELSENDIVESIMLNMSNISIKME